VWADIASGCYYRHVVHNLRYLTQLQGNEINKLADSIHIGDGPANGDACELTQLQRQMQAQASALEVRLIAGPPERRPIVFLHEGLGSVSMWTQRGLDWPAQVCAATKRAGVVYSRPGYGQSPRLNSPAQQPQDAPAARAVLPADYMHREAWQVLPALLARLGIAAPVLLGHSDGATIALLYASRFNAAACIALAPHVVVEDVAIEAITAARGAFESGELRQRLFKHHRDVDLAFWQWNDVWLSPAFRHYDIREACKQIRAPLLLLQGLGDEYGTMRQLDEIAAAAPHAVQQRLADCGHSPHRDQPEKSVQAVAGFLKDVA
jgi:pimeloyl-ACP methyl ester carboxylesterase